MIDYKDFIKTINALMDNVDRDLKNSSLVQLELTLKFTKRLRRYLEIECELAHDVLVDGKPMAYSWVLRMFHPGKHFLSKLHTYTGEMGVQHVNLYDVIEEGKRGFLTDVMRFTSIEAAVKIGQRLCQDSDVYFYPVRLRTYSNNQWEVLDKA